MSDKGQIAQREIRGVSKTVRELLSGVKYSIDYYQREYKWTTKQVQELIEDLIGRFEEDYDEAHERYQVSSYGHYFLGSIVISAKNGGKFVIDGQQRLTTLTLLLTFLHNAQRDHDEQVNVKDMIFSEKYGKRSFNIEVEERVRCMEALFNQEPFNETDQPESVRNIVARYADIELLFPADIKDETLPFFIDWLIDNVHLVEITAYSDDDAYTIFETMNDRGLSLSPTDMLKGYLLANITDESKRNSAVLTWKRYTAELVDFGEQDNKEEVADFFKAWLRSQYAESIRERKKRAKPQDFDRLGTEYHRWIRENREKEEKERKESKESRKGAKLGLHRSDDFFHFIERGMAFYARQYILIRKATQAYTAGLEDVFHVEELRFTLQDPVMLAPLRPDDDDDTLKRKINTVARFVETLLVRRVWNGKSITYSNMQYYMFLIMREIRGKSLKELVKILGDRLAAQEESFDNPHFSMHKMNRYMVHRILARMTDTLECESGLASHYTDYVNWTGDKRNPFEVEHIWADHPERHKDEFEHPADFRDYRNRIGGLLLLPKRFNASYRDVTYEKKFDHYFGQNLLAKSLHPRCYEHNPGFLSFIQKSGLKFSPHPVFKTADLDTRQSLYIALAKYTWRPERLAEALE
jgi:uncharacterized protein with ParB-like and HNH nuclease domain